VAKGVRHELVDEEAYRQRQIALEHQPRRADSHLDAGPAMGLRQHRRHAPEVVVHVDPGDVAGVAQPIVAKRHGADAALAVAEGGARLMVPDVGCLKVEEATNDLQVVLHPVVDLLKQRRLLPFALAQGRKRPLTRQRVPNGTPEKTRGKLGLDQTVHRAELGSPGLHLRILMASQKQHRPHLRVLPRQLQ
jgi:hypothetical protein